MTQAQEKYWVHRFDKQIKSHMGKYYNSGSIEITHVITSTNQSMHEYILAVLETGHVLEVNIVPINEYILKHNVDRDFNFVENDKYYKGSNGEVYGPMKMVDIFQGTFRCERTNEEFKANGRNKFCDISPNAVTLISMLLPTPR